MPYADDHPERPRLVCRYVRRGCRYAELCGGGFLAMRGRERRRFARRLAKAAHRIMPRELDILLTCGWRERLVAAWLIAVARRSELRERLGERLLTVDDSVDHAYCLALARLGTPADADTLAAYLDHYLGHPDRESASDAALGALLLLDARHGTDRASRFLTPNGPWHKWAERRPTTRPDSPQDCREFTELLYAYAAESAQYVRHAER